MSGHAAQKRAGAFDHYDNGHGRFQKHPRPSNPNTAPVGPRGQNANTHQNWNKGYPTPQHGPRVTQKDRTGEGAYIEHVSRVPDPSKCEPCKLAKQEVDSGLIALLTKVEAEELRPDGDKDILRSAVELRQRLSARNSKRHAKWTKELDEARPVEGKYVLVPEYIEQKMELAKDLPSLPPILEPSMQEQVFTHSSVHEPRKHLRSLTSTNDLSYERLEFIGDAYIELLATRLIAYRLPHLDVPAQAHFREQLVRNDTLSAFSNAYSLPDRLNHSSHEKGGKMWVKITADVFEAYVAAVILSDPVYGFAIAEKWLNQLWTPQMLQYKEPILIENPKAQEDLTKLIHMNGIKLDYFEEKNMEMTATGQQRFQLGVYLTGWGYEKEWLGSGEGRNKMQASVNAAQDAITRNSNVLQTSVKKKQDFLVQQQFERDQMRQELRKQAEGGDEHALAKLKQILGNDIRIKRQHATKGVEGAAAKLEELLAEEASLDEKFNANLTKQGTIQDGVSLAKSAKSDGLSGVQDNAAKSADAPPPKDKKKKSSKQDNSEPIKEAKKSTKDFLADIMTGNVDAKSTKAPKKDGSSWLEREQKKKEKEERKKMAKKEQAHTVSRH